MNKLYLNYQIIQARGRRDMAHLFINGVYYTYSRNDDLGFTTNELSHHLNLHCPKLIFSLELSTATYCKVKQSDYNRILIKSIVLDNRL